MQYNASFDKYLFKTSKKSTSINTYCKFLIFFIRHRLQKLLINRTSKSKLGLPKPDDRF